MSLDQCWSLSRAWYGGRFEPEWQPFSVAEKQTLLRDAGLDGAFWSLTP